MKTDKDEYSTLQKNVNKWQRKYAAGEVDWETADLAIRTLIVQYQRVKIFDALKTEITREGVKMYGN
jgi:hypothetical protein